MSVPDKNVVEVFPTTVHPQGQTVTVRISWGDQFQKFRLTPTEAAELREALTNHLEGNAS